MSTDQRKIRNYGLAGFFSCLLLFIMVQPGIVQAANPQAPKVCATHFYPYDARPGSHQFGPNQTALVSEAAKSLSGSEKDVHKTFDKVRGCDPLIAATVHEFVLLGQNIDPVTTRNLAVKYVHDRKAWNKDSTWLNNQVASYSVNFSSRRYETLAALPGSNPSVMPTLFKVDRKVKVEYVFTLHLKNGQTREFRLICLFQPVTEHFPHMPPIPTNSCTSNCSPPPVCTPPAHRIGYSVNPVTCVPFKNSENTYGCQQNGGSNCPPEGGVQTSTAGTKGDTPGAGPRPSPLPVVTKNPGQPNPTPNSSGYDSGGGTNSAPNGGSCTTGSGCTSQPDPTTTPVDTGQGGSNSSPAPGGPG